MPQPYQPFKKASFSLFGGGIATQDEPTKIPVNCSPDLLNVRPIGQGAYGPRNGISLIGNDNSGIGNRTGVYNFAKGTEQILISPRGTTIEYLKKSNNTWTAIPGAPTYTDSKNFGFANDNRYLYFCNAYEDFAIWDGKDLTGTITVDVPSNVITCNNHGLELNNLVTFTSSGTLPAGITAGVVYFVISVTANTFKISTTFSGSEVDITGAGTGTHTFASSIKTYSSAPKGNILQYFNNRLFVSGVIAEPVTVYWSVINDGTKPSFDFASSGSGSYTAPDGGDYITAMRVFTLSSGTKVLEIFKKTRKIYVLSFDSSGNVSVLEDKQDTGALNQKSTIIIENDIFYIDTGNNINNLGFRENIQNQIRTESSTVGLDRTTTSLIFDNPCAVYWKKRRMAFFACKSYGSTYNDVVLVYFYDFKSWWVWKGINANEFTVYNDEIVWASSVDKNVYKYDETKFDDLDVNIYSIFQTKDIEFSDQNGNPHFDVYKKARYAVFKGYISPGATMNLGIIYDGNNEKKIIASFSGSDDKKTVENLSIYFGSNILGYQAFGGYAQSPSSFPMREFFVVMSLDLYSHLRVRLFTEVQQKGTPYIINNMSLYAEENEIDSWPAGAVV